MGLLDVVLGRKRDMEPERVPAGISREDARVVERYEQLLRTASPDVIEQVHVEAFEKLTPEQLDLLFERFTADAPTNADRPADSAPGSLARTAAMAESRRPGWIARTLKMDEPGTGLNSLVGASILDAVIWYAIASSAWSTWATAEPEPANAEAVAFDDAGWDFGL